MVLALVREEFVRVEELRPKDVVVLPSSRRVTVERVDEYDGSFFVRWWRSAERGEPGHRGGKNHEEVRDASDGRYLGSIGPMRRGETVTVHRG